MPAEGILTLHAGDKAVGQGRIKAQPGKFSIAGEGLNVGKDSRQLFVELAAGVRMAFMRD